MGCLGGTTTSGNEGDAEDSGTTVINNYYNNTTIEAIPEYITKTGSGAKGAIIVTINQSAGTAIHLLDWSGTIEMRYGSTNWTAT